MKRSREQFAEETRFLKDLPSKATKLSCFHFTIIPKTGVGLPETGIIFYCVYSAWTNEYV